MLMTLHGLCYTEKFHFFQHRVLKEGKMSFNNVRIPGMPNGSAASALLKFGDIVVCLKNDSQCKEENRALVEVTHVIKLYKRS
uniref:Uncharacterized protein n=1 Tax=Lactuca sativa TaxID=4236 RepID=A0A9R1W9Y9_LACSA|nr:hypothetical protein LSAT_V11C300112590 [Lactuca sativa]